MEVVDSGISKVYYKHDYRCEDGINYLKSSGVVVQKINDEND